jgi:hypothetical protein
MSKAKAMADRLESFWRWDVERPKSVTVPLNVLEDVVACLRAEESRTEAELVPIRTEEWNPAQDAAALSHLLAEERGHVVVKWDSSGRRILAVARCSAEGKVISVLAEAPSDEERDPAA